ISQVCPRSPGVSPVSGYVPGFRVCPRFPCVPGFQSRTGHTNMGAVVGLVVFCQYWFWYPLTHFLSLAFTPACIVGLNADLKMPQDPVESKVDASVSLSTSTSMSSQLRVLTPKEGSKYTPVKELSHGGIIMLKNVKPEEEEQLVEFVQAGGPKVEEEAEPEPPEPFEWTED
ncbi:hypothetical protein BaRGS_00040590, partial [Batillaria attramentaria]